MSEIKLTLDDTEQLARLAAIEAALKQLTAQIAVSGIIPPHVDWTISNISEQESTQHG